MSHCNFSVWPHDSSHMHCEVEGAAVAAERRPGPFKRALVMLLTNERCEDIPISGTISRIVALTARKIRESGEFRRQMMGSDF